MKLKAIIYPLICLAIVFSFAGFLVIKNKDNSTSNPTSEINSSAENDDSNEDMNGGLIFQTNNPSTEDSSEELDYQDENVADEDVEDKAEATNPVEPIEEDTTDLPETPLENPVYKIVLLNISENLAKTKASSIGINYAIMLGDLENVAQDVSVEVLSDGAKIISSDAPIILIKRLEKGEVKLKITCLADETVYQIIKIIFE